MYGKAAYAAMIAAMGATDRPMPWAVMHKVAAPTLLTWGRDDRVSHDRWPSAPATLGRAMRRQTAGAARRSARQPRAAGGGDGERRTRLFQLGL